MDTVFDIFDCHQHVGSTADAHGGGVAGQVKGGAINDEEVRCRLEFMERASIRQAVAIPGHNYNRADGIAATRRENDAIARYRDRNPDRFPVAAGILEPLDEAAGLAEIDRIAGELGLRAVSFHTEYQSVTIDSPWMLRYLDRMGELGLVPLVHASNVVLHEALWRLGKVARALPDLTIVAIEPFFTHDGMEESFFIADVAPNVLFETASCFDTDILLGFVERFGSDRVIFGSQYYSRIVAAGQTSAHQRRCLASFATSSRRSRSATRTSNGSSVPTRVRCSGSRAQRSREPRPEQASSRRSDPRPERRIHAHAVPIQEGARMQRSSRQAPGAA